MLKLLKNVNLALAFLLELCALVAWGYWGFQVGSGLIAKIGLGIGAPVVAIVVWALFGAPRSARRLRGTWLLLLRIVFFGSSAVALFIAGQPLLGGVLAFVVVVNLTLMYVWRL